MNEARPDAFAALNELADHVYETARSKGFHEEPVPMATSVANLHSETSELWEAFRDGKLNHYCDKSEKMKSLGIEPLTCMEEELADIVIRALDTAKENGVDIAKAVRMKDAYNKTRAHRNGGKAA